MPIEEKWIKVQSLLLEVNDPMVHAFFDTMSEELLDEKIEVLTALIKGKKPSEIPKYYDILELKPDDKNHWDI
jgi:hypothetical protein